MSLGGQRPYGQRLVSFKQLLLTTAALQFQNIEMLLTEKMVEINFFIEKQYLAG